MKNHNTEDKGISEQPVWIPMPARGWGSLEGDQEKRTLKNFGFGEAGAGAILCSSEGRYVKEMGSRKPIKCYVGSALNS